METASKWLCSFYADNVRIQQHRTAEITCGNSALLCRIELTHPNSKFSAYHENKIVALYDNESTTTAGDCEFRIEVSANGKELDVYCDARRAGRATVKFDLGKWYLFEGKRTYYIVIAC